MASPEETQELSPSAQPPVRPHHRTLPHLPPFVPGRGILRVVKDLWWVPLYRAQHCGGVVEHALAGDIFYLEILGRKIVVVNNYEMANELMDKRSANYSDRPVFPLFMKYVGLDPIRAAHLLSFTFSQPRMGRQRDVPEVRPTILQAASYPAAVSGQAGGRPFQPDPHGRSAQDAEEHGRPAEGLRLARAEVGVYQHFTLVTC